MYVCVSLYDMQKKQMERPISFFLERETEKKTKNLNTSCFCYDLNTRAEINRPQAIFLYIHIKNDPWIEKSVQLGRKVLLLLEAGESKCMIDQTH